MSPTHMLLPAVRRFKTGCSCVFGSCINFLQGFQQFLLLPEEGKNILHDCLLNRQRLESIVHYHVFVHCVLDRCVPGDH